MHVKAEVNLKGHFLGADGLVFLRQGPLLTQNSLSKSSWLQQASGITGIVSMCYHLQFWGSNSSPRACKECSSLTKPSPCLPLSPLLRLDLHCSWNSGWRRGRERQEAISLLMSTWAELAETGLLGGGMENPTAEKILWDSMEPDTTDWSCEPNKFLRYLLQLSKFQITQPLHFNVLPLRWEQKPFLTLWRQMSS